MAFCNKAGPTDRFWATLRRQWALPAVAIGWVATGTSTFPLVGMGVAKGKSPARWLPFLFLSSAFSFFLLLSPTYSIHVVPPPVDAAIGPREARARLGGRTINICYQITNLI